MVGHPFDIAQKELIERQLPCLGAKVRFRFGQESRVEETVGRLPEIGITELAVSFSSEDLFSPEKRRWQIDTLGRLARVSNVTPLLPITELWEKAGQNGDPDFAALLDLLAHILQSAPQSEWVALDLKLSKDAISLLFGDEGTASIRNLLLKAAQEVKRRGRKLALLGMPVLYRRQKADPASSPLDRLLSLADAIGMRDLLATDSWEEKIEACRRQCGGAEVWLADVPASSSGDARQLAGLWEALETPVERIYWPRLFDSLHDRRGLLQIDGSAKTISRLSAKLAKDGSTIFQTLDRHRSRRHLSTGGQTVLITGGAGFIGVNLADRLARAGRRVLILDNLCRPGVEENLQWLCTTHGDRILVELDDLRNQQKLQQLVSLASEIFHCAGQVAVTTSISSPQEDFEVNARGTLNLLEALRTCAVPPPLLFTSTNKVYGSLSGLNFSEEKRRFAPRDQKDFRGVAEHQPLDFYSPYGCSKGTADQYVLDYARIYGLNTVVFRMSCIYGPHQHGTEDQGWVAHFLIRVLQNKPITIYGNGKQVRDILHVDDLVEAFTIAMDNVEKIKGRAFNMGGGTENAISLLEFLDYIAELHDSLPEVRFADWRPGDQVYYVSDTIAFQKATGWTSKTDKKQGIRHLYECLQERFSSLPHDPKLEAAAL